MVTYDAICYELELVIIWQVLVLSQFQEFIINFLRCNRVVLNWDTIYIDENFCSFLRIIMGEQDALVGIKPFVRGFHHEMGEVYSFLSLAP